jgi:serine/threonine-protein kinase
VETGQIVAGKYRLNRLLGTGGMATVWSATNTFTERQFAVKFMLPGVAKTKEAVDRFLQEAKVSARIDHPNIIEIIDVGQTEDGALFLVMELLTGVPLETALRRQNPPMTLTELTFVMVEVARALSAAHRNGVVHRDLKPSNVFLHKERDGRPVPKILDFGVSKFLEEEAGRLHALTVQGTVLGSPLYMSPEQARGETRVDGRSDIFSFGAILFEALSGFRPFDAPNFNALIVKIATGKPRDIDESAPHVPESLRSIVRDCLETNLDKRADSFDVIAERLMAALPDLEAANVHVPAPASGLLPHDPDATTALPVVRPSDRPPANPPSYAPPPSNTPSNGTLSTTTSIPVPSQGLNFDWRNPTALLIAGAITFAVVVIGVIVIFTVRAFSTENAPAPPKPGPTTVMRQTDVTGRATADAPAVRVDALPAARPKVGHLTIQSQPATCVVSIDGNARGQTPLNMVELTEGPHMLECTPAHGKTVTARVNVTGGASARHVFALK